MPSTRISRRIMLRGLGTVTIGLPFLEEMLIPATAAAPQATVPVRAFNVFFGLGIPSPLQTEGFEGVLEPLKPLADKLLIMRNVDHVRADEPGINAHYDGSSAAFTAAAPNGSARAGGPSLDQVIRHHHYSNGLPPGMIPSLVAGTYFRRNDRPVRYVHSFNADGTAAGAMQESLQDLFSRIFGSTAESDQAADPRRQTLNRSVLDSVVEQTKLYTGTGSPLGARSNARLTDQLDRVREYEQRAFEMQKVIAERCQTPGQPADSKLIHGDQADPGGEGSDITLEELTAEWRLMAELYALAIACDRARFGSITFLAAGQRIRLKGKYEYEGRTVFEFDDAAQRKSSGANACSHEWWHAFNESKKNEQLRAHAHMKMREVAYFLTRLDGPDAVEANGKTLLENSLITISTESGDGRHNDVKRELSGIFHAVTGAGGRIKTGQIMDVGAEGIDVYNTALAAMHVLGEAADVIVATFAYHQMLQLGRARETAAIAERAAGVLSKSGTFSSGGGGDPPKIVSRIHLPRLRARCGTGSEARLSPPGPLTRPTARTSPPLLGLHPKVAGNARSRPHQPGDGKPSGQSRLKTPWRSHASRR